VAASIHALVLLSTVFVTLVLTVKFGDSKKERVLGGILFPAMLLFLGFILAPPGIYTPVSQWLFPILCLSLAMIFLEPKFLRRGTCITLVLTAIFLSFHFFSLTSSEKYTDIYPSRSNGINEGRIRMAEGYLHSLPTLTDNNSYPQGWLSESEVLQYIPEEDRRFILERDLSRSYYLWHSYFTNVYGAKQGKVDIWYLGGTLKESAQKLEWKEKVLLP
jgi:hypothetical protein